MTEPRYQDLRGAQMPVVNDELRVFSGTVQGVTGPALNHVPVTMVEIHLAAGAAAHIDLPPTYNAFTYVISGSLDAATETQVIWFEREEGDVTLIARTDTHAILFAGEPVNEPVVQRGPFVMNTMSEILRAYEDYQNGAF